MICAKIKGQNLYSNTFRECVHLTNIIRNSSFETDDVWANVVYDTTEHLYGNRSSKFAGGSGTVLNSQNTIAQPIVGHVYYGRHYVKTNGNATPADCRFEWYYTDAPGSTYVFGWNNGNYPDWHMESTILTVTANNGTYVIRNFTVNTNVDVYCDGLMIVDLTEAFGSGNEPDQAWCDTNIPYFDGAYELDMAKVEISQDGIEAQGFVEEDNSSVGIVGGTTMKANTLIEAIVLKNIVPNNSFEQDTEWTGVVYDTTEHYQGTRSSKLAGTTVNRTVQISTPIVGHKYYGRNYIKSQGDIQPADCRFEWYAGDGEGLNFVFAWNRGNFPNWTMQSAIATVNVVNGTSYIVRNFVVNAVNPCWTDCLMIVDLTEAFGSGNEPNKEWCDSNIPYFESAYEMRFEENSWLF